MAKNNFKAKEAAYLLISTKMLHDYCVASSKVRGIEVEHFAEDWMKHNLDRPGKLMERAVWRFFIDDLMEQNRRKKSRG